MSIANELQRIKNAKNLIGQVAYDANLQYTDEDGNPAKFTLDAEGNVTQTIDKVAEGIETIEVHSQKEAISISKLEVSEDGVITAEAVGTYGVIIPAGDFDYPTRTKELAVQSANTITPTNQEQVAVAKGKYTTGEVKVAPIPEEYVDTTDITKNEDDVTVNENKVDVPAGYYPNGISKTVPTLNVLKENIDVLQQEPVGTDENSIVGIWVFKNELSIPNDFYGKEYTFRYFVHDIPDEGSVEHTALGFLNDGAKYMECLRADGEWTTVYQGTVGWFGDMQAYKTITIIDEPTDATFIAWLKANATRQESVVGTWVFKDELSVLEGLEEMSSKTYPLSFSVNAPNGYVLTFTGMGLDSAGEVSFYDADGSGITPAYSEDWLDEKYKTITITKAPTDETFIAWFRANAKNKEVGNSLYVMRDVNTYVKHLWIGLDRSLENALKAI